MKSKIQLHFRSVCLSFLLNCSIFFISFFFSGCTIEGTTKHDCAAPKSYTDSITQIHKSKIPYLGYEHLLFLRTFNGDTEEFVGIGTVNGFSQSSYSLYPECPSDKINLEYQTYKFNNIKGTDPIYLVVYVPGHYAATDIKFSFKNANFIQTMNAISPSLFLYPSRNIRGKQYDSIYSISGSINDRTDTTSYVWYNYKYGLLKIKLEDGDTWEIIN